MFTNKKIVLGITAGIAAYKTAALTRLFVKAGAEVRVVMTPSATDFVTPLTLATLSKNEVLFDWVTDPDNPRWNNHVELALWADMMVIAPATANTLSKMANGQCDNLLLAVYLSAKCPVYFAPAMDLDMYKHPSTKTTFEKLQNFGNIMIPAGFGELASGLVGEGRLAEPEEIVAFISQDLLSKQPLRDKKVLVTAGPTYEAIDPVRFIGNYSSGKMGYALAEVLAQAGAQVSLISGPSFLQVSHPRIQKISVTSAQEMYAACESQFDSVDIAVFAAAVADFKPKNTATQKIKKSEATLHIDLEPTIDVLGTLSQKKNKQVLVGFALETENELENAKIKLKKKNLDLIVLNSLNTKGAGFHGDTNQVTVIRQGGQSQAYPMKSKLEVAQYILNEIITLILE